MSDMLQNWIFHKPLNASQDGYIPDVQQWLSELIATDIISLALVCVGALSTGIVLCLGILHLMFVLKFISSEAVRADLYWIVFMAPVVAACGLVGAIVPRAAIFLYAIALVYFMICIFVLVRLMCALNGSRELMCSKLLAKEVRISLQVCPLGCCLFCLKKIAPTEKNFLRFEWLVFQSPIIRILLEVLNICVFMETSSRANYLFQITNLIGMLSLLLGSYASYIIIPAGASLLAKYRFLLLFRLVDFSQLIWSVQKVVADVLSALDPFKKQGKTIILPPSALWQFYISVMLCVEMLIVSMFATWWFRPSHCAFFDGVKWKSGPNDSESAKIKAANQRKKQHVEWKWGWAEETEREGQTHNQTAESDDIMPTPMTQSDSVDNANEESGEGQTEANDVTQTVTV